MKTYLVGGAVRDQLLGRVAPERDWVVVGGTPAEMRKRGFRQVGRDFPVFLHPDTGDEYALARTERRTGPGHADFACDADPSVTLEEDLLRRDLTVNAIAWDGTEYIDPYGGRKDIDARVLRHVSPAFRDDPLRVFRVARFAAVLPAFTVSEETLELMAAMVPELAALSGERVWQELKKAVSAPCPERFFAVLRNLGGAWWFDGIDLDATAALFESRSFNDQNTALAALGWVNEPITVRGLYAKLRAPRLIRRAGALLAAHGEMIAQPSVAAGALLDALHAIEAFRPGDLAGLVLNAAECCAQRPLDARRQLIQELRVLRVDAQPGPGYGIALRAERARFIGMRLASPPSESAP